MWGIVVQGCWNLHGGLMDLLWWRLRVGARRYVYWKERKECETAGTLAVMETIKTWKRRHLSRV